jgi:hypothetical protein
MTTLRALIFWTTMLFAGHIPEASETDHKLFASPTRAA